MRIGCYSLDLYCSNPDCYRHKIPEGFVEDTLEKCINSAKTKGWAIDDNHDLCHKCKRRKLAPVIESLEGEIWKSVDGFSGYRISNLGRLLNVRTGRLRKFQRTGSYVTIQLRNKEGKPINNFVHALVAAAFLGPRPKGYDIHHKDANTENNRWDNLEYLSHSANLKRAVRSGAICGRVKLTKEQVLQIRKEYSTGRVTLHDLAIRYGVRSITIWEIVKLKSWRYI